MIARIISLILIAMISKYLDDAIGISLGLPPKRSCWNYNLRYSI